MREAGDLKSTQSQSYVERTTNHVTNRSAQTRFVPALHRKSSPTMVWKGHTLCLVKAGSIVLALRKLVHLFVFVAVCRDVESLSVAKRCLCGRGAKPAHVRLPLRGGRAVRLQLRGGQASTFPGTDEELEYPGPFGPISEAIAVATSLRRPLKISSGVHSW